MPWGASTVILYNFDLFVMALYNVILASKLKPFSASPSTPSTLETPRAIYINCNAVISQTKMMKNLGVFLNECTMT